MAYFLIHPVCVCLFICALLVFYVQLGVYRSVCAE